MPTYEYECQECKHRFEKFQRMNDDPVSECAKCYGKVRRLIGAGAGIIFKGSGFYVNDYKKSSNAVMPDTALTDVYHLEFGNNSDAKKHLDFYPEEVFKHLSSELAEILELYWGKSDGEKADEELEKRSKKKLNIN